MSDKPNGSYTNGSGRPPGGDDEEGRVVKFPTLAERDRMRKEKLAEEERQEKEWRKAYRKSTRVPFFNMEKIPPFAGAMALAFLVIHGVFEFVLSSGDQTWVMYTLGFVPSHFLNGDYIMGAPGGYWALISPVSYLFLHGGWMHIIFNVVMWLALGTFFEREYGAREAVKFFVLCALGGALFHFLANPFSDYPVVGASASISGFFGVVFVRLYQRGMGGPLGRYGITPLILFWLGLMIFMGLIAGGNIAWMAHIGGFVTGLLYLSWTQRRSLRFWSF